MRVHTHRPVRLRARLIHLVEDPFLRPHGRDEDPFRVVGVVLEVDLLGPLVADLEWEFELLALAHAAAALVGAAPVLRVADEVVDDLGRVVEGGLGGSVMMPILVEGLWRGLK